VSAGGTAIGVGFGGPAGTLDLAQPQGLGGTISGWQVGDVIDFVSTSVTSAWIYGTSLSVIVSGGQTFSYQLSGQQADTLVSSKSDGNNGTDLVLTYVAPAVSVSINNSDLNLANNTASVTFTFSQAPTDFRLADTSWVGGTLSNLHQVDAMHYTATFTASAGTDITNASLNATSGSWHDIFGTAGAGGSTGSVNPRQRRWCSTTPSHQATPMRPHCR
jgi:hypothetical protein